MSECDYPHILYISRN